MTKEIQKKESSAAALFSAAPTEIDFDPSDILIPKILLMQGPSKLVAQGEAAQGDMINSVTNLKVGDKKNPISFAPLMSYKTMMIMKDKGGMFVYDRIENWNPIKHANAPWEFKEENVLKRNYPMLNFYVMLKSDLEKGSGFPCLIGFRSTSYKAGQKLINIFAEAAELGKKPFARMVSLSCKLEQGEKGPFHMFDIKAEGETEVAYGPKLVKWETILKQGKHKIDDKEEVAVEKDVATPPPAAASKHNSAAVEF